MPVSGFACWVRYTLSRPLFVRMFLCRLFRAGAPIGTNNLNITERGCGWGASKTT